MTAVLFALLVTLAAQLTPRPGTGRHHAGAPKRPARAPGRHEGRIRPAYGELGLVPAAGRHESGEHPIVTDQALEAAA